MKYLNKFSADDQLVSPALLGTMGNCYAQAGQLDKAAATLMKAADKAHARYTVIIGDDELANGQAVVRNMATSSQETISLEEVINYVK